MVAPELATKKTLFLSLEEVPSQRWVLGRHPWVCRCWDAPFVVARETSHHDQVRTTLSTSSSTPSLLYTFHWNGRVSRSSYLMSYHEVPTVGPELWLPEQSISQYLRSRSADPHVDRAAYTSSTKPL